MENLEISQNLKCYVLTYKNVQAVFIKSEDIEKLDSIDLLIGGQRIFQISNDWLNYLNEKQNKPEYIDFTSEFIEYIPGSLAKYHEIYLYPKLNPKYVENATETIKYQETICIHLESMTEPYFDYNIDGNDYGSDIDDELDYQDTEEYITYRYEKMLYDKHKNGECECVKRGETKIVTKTKTIIKTEYPVLMMLKVNNETENSIKKLETPSEPINLFVQPQFYGLELPIKQPNLDSPNIKKLETPSEPINLFVQPQFYGLEIPMKQPEPDSPNFKLNILRFMNNMGGLAFSSGCTLEELKDEKLYYKNFAYMFKNVN